MYRINYIDTAWMCWVRHMSTVLDYVSRSPGAHVSQLLLYEAHRIKPEIYFEIMIIKWTFLKRRLPKITQRFTITKKAPPHEPLFNLRFKLYY